MIPRIAAELPGTGFLVFFGAGALAVGGTALSQVWLFIVAPLVGGLVAVGLHRLLHPEPEPESLASGGVPPPIAG